MARPSIFPRQAPSDENRWRRGATRLGISFEEYRDQVRAGKKWCSYCKKWQPRSEFRFHKRRGLNTICLESERAYAREYQRRLWAADPDKVRASHKEWNRKRRERRSQERAAAFAKAVAS